VGAVAETRIGTVLTTAEIYGFGFRRFEFYRRKSGALVAAVAEGLAGAQAAGTPEIALAGFNFDCIRTLLGNVWFCHGELSLKLGIDIIADCGD
jgi:hypothetical protein